MKELLDTDRVNFLVWRYLLESNYRETAAKLQKEWRVNAPHRDFEFAPNVHTYALVTLLNKGLIFEDYQRKYEAEQQLVPGTAEARGVFGPLKYEPAMQDAEGEDDDEDDSEPEPEVEERLENPRKRPVDRQHHALPNASSAKRQRLSNGYDNGADSATTPMEIDHHTDSHNNNHAYPSPLEGEQAASPLPRTEGPEQGTQVDKVHELTQETVFLRLGADGASEGAEPSPTRTNENPIVLHCEWNPNDPSILAAAGTDALARIWTVSRGAAPEDTMSDHVDSVTRAFKNLLDDDVPRNATVSAMAWNTTGTAIALAVEIGNKARVTIAGLDGASVHRFDGIEPPVLKLRWSPNNEYILGISPENGGALATVFSSSAAESRSHLLADNDLNLEQLDATWISESEFILCGGATLISLRCTEQGIVPGREFKTSREDTFAQVQFDWRSKLVATASTGGTIDLWDEQGNRRLINAHLGPINALQWQPLKGDAADDERLLASGGDDGAICIWNVRSMDNKPKYSMTMNNLAVVGLSITPDGAFLAGATSEKILIWKIGENAIPRASWNRVPHPGWQSPKGNSESDEEFMPCLGWDSEGQKLVYGANSRLAVINFR
ncbi:WD40-repeat-containing domain protein [Immersiella caudata]|uniref:WD40-repeat-containing domain protein n=1 Tax=Immersiella caudata TaxID=314043 RepID=A0AA40C5P5_9PEZI|nr:WD40-repeat-containing domain protein [Immersiella caudata]